jgi:hypothetical protein
MLKFNSSMKLIIFTLALLCAYVSYSQNVGIGTASPGTKLDVNGALTYRETVVAVSSNAATIPANVSQVQLTGSATATIAITPPTPPNAGQVLVIYNNTSGGYGATLGATTIPAGTALQFVYSNGAWVTTDAEAAGSSSYYIQNQASAPQPGAGFNTAGSGTIAGTLTLTPMTSGSVLFAGTGGVVSQNNADIFWDNTNYRLGIGTASPVSPLHVASAATSTLPISLLLGLQPGLVAGAGASVYEKMGVALSTANEVDLVFNYMNASTTTATANATSNNFGIGFYGVSPVATFYPNGNVLVKNLAGTGYRPVYADASGDLYTISGSNSNRKLFSYTGGSQSWTVPAGVNLIFVKLWGGGGASAYSTGDGPGGAGGFVSGFLSVTPGSSLTIVVGEGGIGGTSSGNSSGTQSTGSSGAVYGGGGLAGHGYSGTGGGRSAIQVTSGTDAVTAGAGGGGSRNNIRWGAGGGGGLIGASGSNGQIYNGGSGGTQTAGGIEIWNGTSSQNTCSGEPGSQYQGGRGCTANDGSGGGGGGWYGGGGGGGGGDGPAGGGSSYISGLVPYMPIRNEQGATVNNYSSGYTIVQSVLILPGGTDGTDYTTGIGSGGPTVTSGTTGTNGGNGQVVIYW